jgi:hypothetical protein
MSALEGVGIAVIIGAAICVPIVVLMHRSLMPDSAQLPQIDAAVQNAAPPGSVVHRLRAPDRIESDGHATFGYFTYDVSGKASPERYRANWRITDGQVHLISLKPL